MKKVALFLIFSCMAYADDLQQLFQREYAYLVNQKKSYSDQKILLKMQHLETMKVIQGEIEKYHKEVAKLTVENELRQQEVNTLENFLRENQNADKFLFKIYKEASEVVNNIKSELVLEKKENSLPISYNHDFKVLFKEILEVLNNSGQVLVIKTVYRDSLGNLKEGKINRYGKLAASIDTGNGLKPLGPNPDGVLTELEGKRFSPNTLYLFNNLTEVADPRKPAIWIDFLANIIPVIILALMFMAVCGLFLALMRE